VRGGSLALPVGDGGKISTLYDLTVALNLDDIVKRAFHERAREEILKESKPSKH
jgi:hypothetical protein